MSLPPTCHCGIYLSIPHEHAQGLPKIGAPFQALSEFGSNNSEALAAVDRLIVQGLLAKVGEGLYKVTDRGFREAETSRPLQVETEE